MMGWSFRRRVTLSRHNEGLAAETHFSYSTLMVVASGILLDRSCLTTTLQQQPILEPYLGTRDTLV